MKRSLSIVLIALILFNTMGYYGFLLGLQYHNNQKLIESLNIENNDLSGTVTIKIPLAIPYSTDMEDFERVDGVFEYKGEFLRLVKQRYYNDTLEIVCIRDVKHQEINNAVVDFANSLTDKQSDTPLAKSVQFIKEYISLSISVSSDTEGWAISLSKSEFQIALLPDYFASIVHPPERI